MNSYLIHPPLLMHVLKQFIYLVGKVYGMCWLSVTCTLSEE